MKIFLQYNIEFLIHALVRCRFTKCSSQDRMMRLDYNITLFDELQCRLGLSNKQKPWFFINKISKVRVIKQTNQTKKVKS